MTFALSLTGVVFGMQATAVKPPATADGGAAGHRFLVLLSRLAQVHVHVDEARADDEPLRDFDHRRAVDRQIAADRGDPVAVDQDVDARRRSRSRDRSRGRP